jgi:tRNA(Arg) A34 adenosine deaminase TadA
MSKSEKEFMSEAIRLATESVKNGGGPFGAVIVKDGEIVAKSSNSVTKDNDPTAHAEVNTIRKACRELNTFDLSGCVIFTSCEPCPMCFGAIHWARLDKIYYANTKADAKNIGFDDSFIYEEIAKPYDKRTIPNIQISRDEALASFRLWQEKTDKIEY